MYIPDSWKSTKFYRKVESNDTMLCEKHAAVLDFTKNQCLGCTEIWGDCSLWQAFAHGRLSLTDDELSTIEAGTCPKRYGGTVVYDNGTVQSVDLSTTALNNAGRVLAKAIRDYVKYWYGTTT